jgi:hypothetical protein
LRGFEGTPSCRPVPDGSAAILLASASAIDRLRLEGGLKASFFAIFRARSLFDTVGGGDGGGLDDMLASRRLVACDRSLIAPVDEATPDAARLGLYYANFVAKLARRRLLLLVVLDDDPEVAAKSLDECRRDAALLGEAHPHCNCEVVVVATGTITPPIHDLLVALQHLPAVSRVYMMTKWLQAGDDTRPVALARNVWPICVARLLAARAVSGPTRSAGKTAPLLAWRTFTWGTHNSSGARSAWEAEYLQSLRDQLIPSLDDSPDATPLTPSDITEDSGATASPTELPAMNWAHGSDALLAKGGVATTESSIRDITDRTCRKAAASAFNAIPYRQSLWGRVKSAWARVASEDGLAHLRHMRDGRLWKSFPLPQRIVAQRDRWRQWKISSQQLDRCRIEHGKALDTLAVARSRHLGLGWHFIIGAMILPFVFQFLAGILLPLRPDDTGDGSPLFSFSGKPRVAVAYLVDRSSSMGGIRLDRMKADLKAAIQELREGTPFTVMAFNEDLEEMPQAAGRLVAATTASRDAAIAWVNGITAQGTTTAVPGLRQLIGLQPDSLVFLTDGQFTPQERTEITSMLADKAFLGKTRIDTVMLYPIGTETALENLARATGGQFRRVGFDPFAPLGFNRVLLITFCATAAGVALGAWLPWLLERLAGISGTAHLNARLQALLDDYGRFSKQTAAALAEADDLKIARLSIRCWAYQRRLAARALSQVEASLAAPSLLHENPQASLDGKLPADALAAEDRRDVHDALDEPLPDWGENGYRPDTMKDITASHAKRLAAIWRTLASKNDPFANGHLPLREIEEGFGDAVGRCLMEASLQLFLPRGHAQDASSMDRRSFFDLLAKLAARITDDVHRPFLSTSVATPEGAMPPRSLAWIGMEWHTSEHDIDEVARDYFRYHTQVRFVSERSVPDVGLRALGLVHEEMDLVPYKQDTGTVAFFVEADRKAESITEGFL